MSTKIEWATETWNPITGCSKISAGCKNCYAEKFALRLAGRYGYPEYPNHFDVKFHTDKLRKPFYWKKPRRIFVCSMGDILHPKVSPLAFAWILDIIKRTPQHTYLILTKRPERMTLDHLKNTMIMPFFNSPLNNLWFGVTVESNFQAGRIMIIRDIPAVKRFISFEPFLENVYFHPWCGEWIDWVIVGAETGPHKRKMEIYWARDLRDQCVRLNIPFFFKKDSSGNHELDGKIWEEFPV